ncbi:MAG: hypothetical protein ACTHJ4_04825 [Candidatus Nucleicultricaceae bacterium]
MNYRFPLLLLTSVVLFSQSTMATSTFAPLEDSENIRKLKIETALFQNGPIADSRLREKFAVQSKMFYSYEVEPFTVQGAGHSTTKNCLDFQMAETEKPITWIQEYLEQEPKPNVNILGLLAGDKYVSQLKMSPVATMADGLVSPRHFVVEDLATDIRHRRHGYARALLVFTTSFLQKIVQDSEAPASLSITFDANREDLFKTIQSSGFTLTNLTPKASEETATPFPRGVTTFSELQSHFATQSMEDASKYSIQAQINLKTIDVAPLKLRIRNESNISHS